jgi:WD40 repeat protein
MNNQEETPHFSSRIMLTLWKTSSVVIAIILAFWVLPAPALDLGKAGALLGIQPSSRMAKPYASLDETFPPTSVTWSPDGKYIADMGMYGDVMNIWDVDQKKIVHVFHEKGLQSPDRHAVTWSPDGRYLAACASTKEVMARVWDTSTWQQVAILSPQMEWSGGCISPVFSPDGQNFAYTDARGDVFVYSTESWQPIAQTGFQRLADQKLLPGESHSILTGEQIAFEPNGTMIAIAVLGLFNDDNTAETIKDNHFIDTSRIIFWDIHQPPPNVDHPSSGQIFEVYGPGPLLTYPDHPEYPPSHSQPGLDAIAFSPDGQEFATGTHASSVSIWNMESKTLIASPLPETRQGEIRTLAYTADGRYLIASKEGSSPPNIYFINAKTNEIDDSISVANYGGFAYSGVRNAIVVGSGLKLFIWQIQ